MFIYKTAVVGAGAMGAEIAQVITYSGVPVLLRLHLTYARNPGEQHA